MENINQLDNEIIYQVLARINSAKAEIAAGINDLIIAFEEKFRSVIIENINLNRKEMASGKSILGFVEVKTKIHSW